MILKSISLSHYYGTISEKKRLYIGMVTNRYITVFNKNHTYRSAANQVTFCDEIIDSVLFCCVTEFPIKS